MKLLKYLVIRATTKGSDAAIKVYNTLYPTQPSSNLVYYKQQEVNSSKPMVPNSPLKPMDKKQEMIESLEYLKSKSVKSKQDKISISMLEAVLKNMK
jgi:hypothetical protein